MYKSVFRIIGISFLIMSLFCGCTSKDDPQSKYRKEGIDYIRNGEYKEAISALDKSMSYSLTVGELEKDTATYKALAQYLMGNTKDAIVTYSSLIDYDKKDWKSYYLRGACYLTTHENTNAINDFEKAIEIKGKDFTLYRQIAADLDAYGMHEEAVDYLNRALEIHTSGVDNIIEKGDVYLSLNNFEEAINCYSQAFEKGERMALLYEAKAYYLTGDLDLAKETLSKCTEWEDVKAKEFLLRGQIKIALEDYEGALKDFKDGAPLADENQKKDLKKGEIAALEHMGEFTMAKDMANEYIKKYPDDKQMADELIFLNTR